MMNNAHDVILRPVLTEKSYGLLGIKQYTFLVDIRANKTEIRQAVEEAFDVEVKAVRTLRNDGKLKRQGRTEGMTPRTKKAYVELKKDSKPIPFFEDMAQ